MRKIENAKDKKNSVVNYELDDGRRVQINAKDVEEHGAIACLRRMGFGTQLPEEPIPVFQRGRRIGTMPADYNPSREARRAALYDPRPDDFRFENGMWIVNPMLETADIDAIPGFVRERNG